jgi:hypothetical protein
MGAGVAAIAVIRLNPRRWDGSLEGQDIIKKMRFIREAASVDGPSNAVRASLFFTRRPPSDVTNEAINISGDPFRTFSVTRSGRAA